MEFMSWKYPSSSSCSGKIGAEDIHDTTFYLLTWHNLRGKRGVRVSSIREGNYDDRAAVKSGHALTTARVFGMRVLHQSD